MEDLLELYHVLNAPTGSADLYVARRIDGRQAYRVAKDSSGNPTLLIATNASDGIVVPPLELPNLTFRPHCVCRVQSQGATESIETAAVLKCSSDDPMLRTYFLRSVAALLPALPDAPTEKDVGAAVNKLVELFRALEAPPRTSLQGIWCELFLIARAPSVRQATLAWHAEPHALHDFSAGRQRVEVKSSLGPIRTHHFRLDQLLPQQSLDVVVVSFILEESGRGTSISELWEEVSAREELNLSLRERMSHVLALCLGRDWRKARRVAFDTEAAADQLRLYDARTIPKVDSSIPAEVTEVQFRAELTNVAPLARAAVVHHGGLFAAMFG